MLGRPPLTQYRMSLHNLHEDGTDLDNYEVGLCEKSRAGLYYLSLELVVDLVVMMFLVGFCVTGRAKLH